MDIITKIQAVLNTLEILDMKPTYNNTNRMLGIFNTLNDIKNELMQQQKEQEGQEDAGEADPE